MHYNIINIINKYYKHNISKECHIGDFQNRYCWNKEQKLEINTFDFLK